MNMLSIVETIENCQSEVGPTAEPAATASEGRAGSNRQRKYQVCDRVLTDDLQHFRYSGGRPNTDWCSCLYASRKYRRWDQGGPWQKLLQYLCARMWIYFITPCRHYYKLLPVVP